MKEAAISLAGGTAAWMHAGALTAETLCQMCGRRAFKFAQMISTSTGDAEDLAQDALERAIRGLKTFDPAKGDLDAWLWRIVVNAGRDAGRIARRERIVFERLAGLWPADHKVVDVLGGDELLAAVRSLSPRHRAVVALRYGADLDYRHVGLALGISLPSKQDVCCNTEGTLVDQFAVEYQRIYSPDPLAMTFKPLAGPASQLGARLKLHITSLQGLRPEFQPISADWTLNLTLIQQAGKALAAPGPVTANGITYTLKSARLSGKQLRIDFSLSGPAVDAQRKLAYETRSPQFPDQKSFAMRFVNPRLVGPNGNPIFPNESGFTIPRQGPITGRMTAVVDGSGHYTVTFGNAPGGPSFPIDIP